MNIKAIAFVGLLTLSAPASGAELYISAGKTIYDFNSSGQLANSADVDTINYTAEGLTVGPDNRLYAAIAFGNHRVDSFDLNLGSHFTGYVTNGQGGIFVPLGDAFGPDGNLYVASNYTNSIDRFYGPSAAVPGSNNPSPSNSGATWSSALTGPVGVAFTPDGTLYASSQNGTGAIYTFNPTTGAAVSVATSLGSSNVGQIAINAAGTALYVRDNNQILEFTIKPDHTLIALGALPLSYADAATLDSSYGLALGPDGFLYATTRSINGSLNPANNGDFVLKINPITGASVPFVQGNINGLTSAQNPAFLVFAPVPEPGTFALAVVGGVIGLGAWRRRRRCKG